MLKFVVHEAAVVIVSALLQSIPVKTPGFFCHAPDSGCKTIVQREHGIEAIVAALRVHPTSIGVQEYATGAIRSIAANNKPGKMIIAQVRRAIKGRVLMRACVALCQ